jgi:hypothetical protein
MEVIRLDLSGETFSSVAQTLSREIQYRAAIFTQPSTVLSTHLASRPVVVTGRTQAAIAC